MTADQELDRVVAWLRGLHWTHKHYGAAQFFAEALSRHEHRETNDG